MFYKRKRWKHFKLNVIIEHRCKIELKINLQEIKEEFA